MNALDRLTRFLDSLTATTPRRRTTGRTRSHGAKRDTGQAKRKGASASTKQADDMHTFTISAPLCVPIRDAWTVLHDRGVRGTFTVLPSLTTNQTALLTTSRDQRRYASGMLWQLAAEWPEGLDIKNDPLADKSRQAVIRNGTKLPRPWKDNGKAWKQPGCKVK